MSRRLVRIGTIMVLAVVMATAAASRAEASFIAYICNDVACTGGAPDVIVTDGGGGDGSASSGIIIASGSFGNLSFLLNVSQSKPAIGSALLPQMDLNFTVTSTGGGEVWMYAYDSGFTGVVADTVKINGNSSNGATVDLRAWGGQTNEATPATIPIPNLLGSRLGLTDSGSGFAGNFVTPTVGLTTGGGVNPYALLLGVHFVVTGAGTTTGDANLNAVPEPATMTLLGTGLFGIAAAARRRRKSRA